MNGLTNQYGFHTLPEAEPPLGVYGEAFLNGGTGLWWYSKWKLPVSGCSGSLRPAVFSFYRYFLIQFSNSADTHVDLADFIPGGIVHNSGSRKIKNFLEFFDGFLSLWAVNTVCRPLPQTVFTAQRLVRIGCRTLGREAWAILLSCSCICITFSPLEPTVRLAPGQELGIPLIWVAELMYMLSP